MPDNLIPRILDFGIAPVAFLLMLVVGLSLELPALAASLKPIRRLVLDLVLAVILPPVAALITVLALRPSGDTAAAILLLAACPVGDIANAYTLLARGSVARSLSLNALTAMLAPISMVAVFLAYPLFGADHHFIAAPPAALALRLVVFLLLPVSIGMTIRQRAPRFATRILPAISGLATVAILLLLALVLANPAFRPSDLVGTIGSATVFLALSAVLCAAFLGCFAVVPEKRPRYFSAFPSAMSESRRWSPSVSWAKPACWERRRSISPWRWRFSCLLPSGWAGARRYSQAPDFSLPPVRRHAEFHG